MRQFVSRAGEKLEFALVEFGINISGLTAADFGSSTGGFTDCLLARGVKKVYAVDVAYGQLAWKLRKDKRVIVYERVNAMHIALPEKVDLITIDVGWTKQASILPNALDNLKSNGKIISLIKLHYEAPKNYLQGGKLIEEKIDEVLDGVKIDIERSSLKVIDILESPILGSKGKNKEFLFHLERMFL